MPLSQETIALLEEKARLEFKVGDRKVGDGIRELLAMHAADAGQAEAIARSRQPRPAVGELVVCGSLPPFIMNGLRTFAEKHAATVEPDARIGRPLLLSRWRLVRFDDCEAKLHVFHRSDDDRAKHDHPWDSVSITLRGGAVDVAEGGGRLRMFPGMVIYRSANYAHWIEVEDRAGPPPMTIFITGPRVREWGFLCPQGWRNWRDFTAPTDGSPSGAVGAGCDDGASS